MSRKTSRGVPRYRDQRGRPQPSGTLSFSPAPRTCTVAEPAPGVTRFQPRTEGLFARIERVQTAGRRLLARARARRAGQPVRHPSGRTIRRWWRIPAARGRIFPWKLTRRPTRSATGSSTATCGIAAPTGRAPGTSSTCEEVQLRRFRRAWARPASSFRYLRLRRTPRPVFRLSGRVRDSHPPALQADRDPHPRGSGAAARTYELDTWTSGCAPASCPLPACRPMACRCSARFRAVGHDGDATENCRRWSSATPASRRSGGASSRSRRCTTPLPPRSLADDDFEMVGLFGNGLPDIVQLNGTAQFWRNLGGGPFDTPRR